MAGRSGEGGPSLPHGRARMQHPAAAGGAEPTLIAYGLGPTPMRLEPNAHARDRMEATVDRFVSRRLPCPRDRGRRYRGPHQSNEMRWPEFDDPNGWCAEPGTAIEMAAFGRASSGTERR